MPEHTFMRVHVCHKTASHRSQVWAEETERWLPGIAAGERLVVASSADKPGRSTPKIVIVSYKMLHRLRSDLLRRAWGMVFICVQSVGLYMRAVSGYLSWQPIS